MGAELQYVLRCLLEMEAAGGFVLLPRERWDRLPFWRECTACSCSSYSEAPEKHHVHCQHRQKPGRGLRENSFVSDPLSAVHFFTSWHLDILSLHPGFLLSPPPKQGLRNHLGHIWSEDTFKSAWHLSLRYLYSGLILEHPFALEITPQW